MITSYTKTPISQKFEEIFPSIIKDYNKYKGFFEYPAQLKSMSLLHNFTTQKYYIAGWLTLILRC